MQMLKTFLCVNREKERSNNVRRLIKPCKIERYFWKMNFGKKTKTGEQWFNSNAVSEKKTIKTSRKGKYWTWKRHRNPPPISFYPHFHSFYILSAILSYSIYCSAIWNTHWKNKYYIFLPIFSKLHLYVFFHYSFPKTFFDTHKWHWVLRTSSFFILTSKGQKTAKNSSIVRTSHPS